MKIIFANRLHHHFARIDAHERIARAQVRPVLAGKLVERHEPFPISDETLDYLRRELVMKSGSC